MWGREGAPTSPTHGFCLFKEVKPTAWTGADTVAEPDEQRRLTDCGF